MKTAAALLAGIALTGCQSDSGPAAATEPSATPSADATGSAPAEPAARPSGSRDQVLPRPKASNMPAAPDVGDDPPAPPR